MVRVIEKNGFHFVGRFSDLIGLLSQIKDKSMTLRTYLELERRKLC